MRVAGEIVGVVLVACGGLLVLISVTAIDEPGAREIAIMFYGGLASVIGGAACVALARRC